MYAKFRYIVRMVSKVLSDMNELPKISNPASEVSRKREVI